jgi:DNA-binding Xre family transcriptional regulator
MKAERTHLMATGDVADLQLQSTGEHPTVTYRWRVREQAEARGIGIQELARRAGVSPSTVQRIWNNPYRNGKTSTLDKLAKGLGISCRELLESVLC